MNQTPHPTTLDFDTIDALPSFSVGQGRLVLGAPPRPGKPSFLFVPGAYHGAWCYAKYLDFFSTHGVGCAAMDLPGHGLLPQTREFASYGIRDFGLCVAQACDAMDGPVILAGHSMGALPVLLAATLRELAGVLLMAPSPPSNVPGAQPLPPVPAGRPRQPPTPAEIRRRFAGTSDDYDVSPVAARLCAESPEALNDRYLLRIAVPPWAIKTPGLCLEAGRDDAARHPEGQDKAIADFFGFEHQILPDMPHCMMYADGWRSSAEAILAWHERLPSASRRTRSARVRPRTGLTQ